MKIIIFGSTGMLGRYVSTYLRRQYELICVDRDQFDPLKSNIADLEQLFRKLQCDHETTLINCIGMIPQRHKLTDTPNEHYIRVNAEFPHLLSAIADRFQSHLIHITTDCVYDGQFGHYDENVIHAETNIYGFSKSLGESRNMTAVRTSIIGEELNNKKSLLEWVRSHQPGQSLKGYDNHWWNGVTCLQLAKIIEKIIVQKLYWKGVRHIYSPTALSKYELVTLIAEVYHLNLDIHHHSTDLSSDRTLTSIYPTNEQFQIPELRFQLCEQRDYHLNYPFNYWLPKMKTAYQTQKPFPHLVLDHAIDQQLALLVQKEILEAPETAYDRYDNPFEQKYTYKDKTQLPPHTQKLFDSLTHESFVKQLSALVGLPLYNDEYRHYWGIHKYQNGDKLDLHVDAGLHPLANRKKQVTLGLYLSYQWKEEYGCHLELWEGENSGDSNPQLIRCCQRIAPLFNRMIIFTNDDYSWHGNPTTATCPSGSYRLFLTLSYLSDQVEAYLNHRKRAYFYVSQDDPDYESKHALRELRADDQGCQEVYRISHIN